MGAGAIETWEKMVENEQTSRMNDLNINGHELATPSGANAPPPNAEPSNSPAPEKLSKEEQWALFEKELKESDWGHQPC